MKNLNNKKFYGNSSPTGLLQSNARLIFAFQRSSEKFDDCWKCLLNVPAGIVVGFPLDLNFSRRQFMQPDTRLEALLRLLLPALEIKFSRAGEFSTPGLFLVFLFFSAFSQSAEQKIFF